MGSNDSREGDKVVKQTKEGFPTSTVKKVKSDGTRVVKDKTGKVSTLKDPPKA